MFAPDMMPVTPEKRTPNTVKKLSGTASSNWEQSKENLTRDYMLCSHRDTIRKWTVMVLLASKTELEGNFNIT